MTADARLEIRVTALTKQRLTQAAELEQRPASDLVRSAIEEYLERLLEDHLSVTQVRADVFDALLADQDDEPVNEPLRRGVARMRARAAGD